MKSQKSMKARFIAYLRPSFFGLALIVSLSCLAIVIQLFKVELVKIDPMPVNVRNEFSHFCQCGYSLIIKYEKADQETVNYLVKSQQLLNGFLNFENSCIDQINVLKNIGGTARVALLFSTVVNFVFIIWRFRSKFQSVNNSDSS